MKSKNTVKNDGLKVGLKMYCSIGGVAIISHWLVNLILAKGLFRLPLYIPAIVSIIPFVSFGIYMLRGKDGKLKRVSHCKYSRFCAFYFTYQENPIKGKNINLEEIRRSLKSCDILLRKNTNYLVELIFSQNSYFTHVGICSREGEDIKIWDCTGELKVSANSLESFCRCSNVAILRFSIDDKKLTENISVLAEEIIEPTPVSEEVDSHYRTPDEYKDVKINEQKVYSSLIDELKSAEFTAGSFTSLLQSYDYENVVSRCAHSLKDAPYDFAFNFKNFERFSCIEYVWYCLKSLYPLHRIKVSDFEYFRFISLPVIIPDVFIKNDFFEHVYTSLPGIENKKKLKEFVETERRQFWNFIVNILLWDLAILFVLNKLFKFLPK